MNTRQRQATSTAAKAISLGFAVFLLLLVEIVVRLVVPTTHLDNILAVLRRDHQLMWRNKPNQHTRFAGTDVFTEDHGFRVGRRGATIAEDKRPDVSRIVCLGASPTFGWGVAYEETYAARLSQLLPRDDGKQVETINAGMIGYSSHQGALLSSSVIASLRPDLITVAYVINDVDRYRFFYNDGRADKDVALPGRWTVAARNVLDRSRAFVAFEKMSAAVLHRRASFDGRPVEIYRPRSVRTPPEDYRDNLRRIAQWAKTVSCRIVFIAMPVNLPIAPPPAELDRQTARQWLEKGMALVEVNRCREAIEPLSAAVQADPNFSEALYQLGVCRQRLHEPRQAGEAFDALMKSEANRCGAAGLQYNRIMAEIAAENGLPLVDAAAAFRAHQGEYLFLSPDDDPIHPNAKGHALIAGLLAEVLGQSQ